MTIRSAQITDRGLSIKIDHEPEPLAALIADLQAAVARNAGATPINSGRTHRDKKAAA